MTHKPAAKSPSQGSVESRPAIIIADDDKVARLLISHRLSREGYRVITCSDGEELLSLAGNNKPVALILDLMMPIMDGYSALRALKANPALAAIPVLVLSGKNQDDEIARCLEAGAADYIIKPFNPADLADRIRHIVSREAPPPHS